MFSKCRILEASFLLIVVELWYWLPVKSDLWTIEMAEGILEATKAYTELQFKRITHGLQVKHVFRGFGGFLKNSST